MNRQDRDQGQSPGERMADGRKCRDSATEAFTGIPTRTRILPRILIVEHHAASSRLNDLGPLYARARWERTTWNLFRAETLLGCSAQLVLASATPVTEAVVFFFSWLRKNRIQVPIIAILPESTDRQFLRTVSDVADDFLFCPLRDEELHQRVERILEPQYTTSEQVSQLLESEMALKCLAGQHPAFLKAVEQVTRFAASEAPVLITGETGTGKELFAHAIHSLAGRRDGPFIPLDCGTLPEHLAENELFGHRRGAFTDAHADQKGLAGMAHGGTLFLDEVDALSLVNQAKLLRFLQEGTYRSLGADRFSTADVRVIAATNRSIEECVQQRQFRRDLYFRMNVLRLHLPPLRERQGDVSLLAARFLKEECDAAKCNQKFFSKLALRKLEHYDWPGNVRELLNTVQRAFVSCSGSQIMPHHISFSTDISGSRGLITSPDAFRLAKQQAIERFERAYVEELMSRHHGNVTQAAVEAGKERRAFGRLVKKYGLNHPSSSATELG
jgi:DNA-binding NtrC family response regulator